MAKKLFLIDAYALIYRTYYAFIKNPRINSKGENTSAIFGFVNIMEDLMRREKPTHLAVAFDPAGKTFRHEAYEAYKAQREETPETIRWSVPFIKEILQAYRIPILEVAGFEADDVVGTVSKLAAKKGFDVYMMTPDKDYGQLVDEHVYLYKPRYGSSEYDILGPQEVCEKYGLERPEQVIDLLSLMGDSSDNIPGCPGIGKVNAQKLIAQFGCVENLLEHTDELKGSIKEKVTKGSEQIAFSKFLATIRTDVPVEFKEEDLVIVPRDEEKVSALFERLEFRTWLNRKSVTSSYSTQQAPTPSRTNFSVESTRKTVEIVKPSSENVLFKNDTLVKETEEPDLFASYADDGEPNLFSCLNLETENAADSREKEKYDSLNGSNVVDYKSYILDTKEKISLFSGEQKGTDFCAICVEMDSDEPMRAKLLAISLSCQLGKNYYVPLKDEDRKSAAEKISALKSLLENEAIVKVGYNLKETVIILNRYGVQLKGGLFDVMIAHYLLQPELSHKLEYLSQVCLKREMFHQEYVAPALKDKNPIEYLSEKLQYQYAAEKPELVVLLKKYLEKEIENENLNGLLHEIELPLIYVLADMEMTGVSLDYDSLKELSHSLNAQLEALEKEIYELAGETFNINSGKQVGDLLFEKLSLSEKVKKTKKTKQYSTSEEVLESIKDKHPIVGKILEYRGLKKLLGTYIDAFPLLVNPETGKIHTSFNQTVTATGRLSSSNPNLQNIPVRDELGKEMRKVFTAGPDEWFVSADYSQIELRLMAEMSQDRHMIEAFKEDDDIHRATAAKLFKVAPEEVTKEMRRKAKTANFGIIYGISNFGLAERMNVSRSEAKTLIDGYFETYPDIKSYMDQVIKKAQDNLFVETLYHRKRYLPDINSHNSVVRSFAERNAVNAPVQGTAADIIKIAMVNIFKQLNDRQLKTKMILQVHDELNFIVPDNELETVKEIVIREMEHAAELSVPLRVEVGVGKNWLEAH